MSPRTNHPDASAREIAQYLHSGDSELLRGAWSGSNILERMQTARRELRAALVQEVRRRTHGLDHAPVPKVDLGEVARRKLEPMVRGLLPRAEQSIVLDALVKSVVFITHDNLEAVLTGTSFDSTAWKLASLYLLSVGAEPLGPDAPRIVGLCEGETCYVSPSYFQDDHLFSDFVVHEAAHLLHDLKRHHLGLRFTRTKVRLVEIDFRKRETFAYSCEAYARILERANDRAHRQALAAEFGQNPCVPDDRADDEEVADLVREAAAARNGWRVIRERLAPSNR